MMNRTSAIEIENTNLIAGVVVTTARAGQPTARLIRRTEMSNMSYCRFRNTLQDLRDCYDNINEVEDTEQEAVQYDSETAARKRLIELCCDIALAYGDEVDREVREI